MKSDITSKLGRIHHGDCIAGMNSLPAGCVDLVFADPPFNIGYKYDVYDDRMAADDYLKWSAEWMQAVHRVLKPDGTFWLAIGDDFAAELKLEAQKAGFHTRSWVVWYYTFGVNCKFKFTRSHTHLFYFVKDVKKFTFREKDLQNRIPSARMLVYNDQRGNPDGRLPDDTWIIPPNIDQTFTLRPQDLEECFQPNEDSWYFPRIAGTFKERAGFHGCQMPEQLLGRIIRSCSEEGEVVMDPFSGSASTLVVAKKLGRLPIGFEMSDKYVKAGRRRLKDAGVGMELTGSPEPTMSAPKTWAKATKTQQQVAPPRITLESRLASTVAEGLVAAFHAVHEGFAVDRVLADPAMNAAFFQECQRIGLPGTQRDLNLRLLKLRKQGNAALKCSRKFSIRIESCEPYLFASEIAWKQQTISASATSLDEILADPELARRFDETAQRFAPGYSSLEYRWGALRLRKDANGARTYAKRLRVPKELGPGVSITQIDSLQLSEEAGIYVVSDRREGELYVGATFCMRDRVLQLFDETRRNLWEVDPEQLVVQHFEPLQNPRKLLAWTSGFLMKATKLPRFNVPNLRAAT